MKHSLYLRLARTDILNVRRFYLPRILAEAGLLGCFYIMLTLAMDKRLSEVPGGSYIPFFMYVGVAVMAILSAVLMLYTNGFVMKQRLRDLGIYHVLGMEKRHVGRLLLYETLLCSAVALPLGLPGGVLLYKLCSLLICRLLATDIVVGFYFITPRTLLPSALFFIAPELLICLTDRIRIARMDPVQLLSARAAGEREPRVRWPITVLGLLTLGAGYGISIGVKQPLTALLLFFVAVFLVIIGTYCLFTGGSIAVLQWLKHDRRFYYHRRRMTAVSGLLYRMKRNALGLGSICIPATGVLVLISTTVSLYSGMQQLLEQHYRREYYVYATVTRDGTELPLPTEPLADIVRTEAEACELPIEDLRTERFLEVSYRLDGSELRTDYDHANPADSLAGLAGFTYITEASYIELGGEPLGLADDELAVCAMSPSTPLGTDTLHLGTDTYRVVRQLSVFPLESDMSAAEHCFGIVVANDAVFERIDRHQREAYGSYASLPVQRLSVRFADRQAACERGPELQRGVESAIAQYVHAAYGEAARCLCCSSSLWEATESVYGMYGTLLFLGILLGLVCLFATVLIIYYKQISEGYEDRARFGILQKLGMSAEEVRGTISAQVLPVFLLPLIGAGIHLCFAFPILNRLLHILLLPDTRLFILSSLIVYAVFALVYVLIYRATARVYYRIVH